MLKIPSVIEARFDAALAEKAVPQRLNFHYKKWLQYYLDFCHKYQLDKSANQSLSDFVKKLREKRQNDQQQKQAAHAISIFYEIGRLKSNKKISSREKIGVSPTKKEHLKPTGADWKPVYDNLYAEIKIRHYSPKTLRAYKGWLRQFQNYSQSKDPGSLSSTDVKDFLTFLAVKKKVSASSQNQAFNALLFLFRHVLKKEFGEIKDIPRAKRKPYIPVVLSRDEIDRIISNLSSPFDLIVKLLYGCGLRLFECMNLRVGCFNFDTGILTVHDGKWTGGLDWGTVINK